MRLALYRFARKLKRIFSTAQVPLEIAFVPSAPRLLRKDTVYLVTEDGEPWTVAMLCPCGCSEVLFMSLIEGSPQWTHECHRNGTVSLHPSIWRVAGCRSHFFLRNGRICWCK